MSGAGSDDLGTLDGFVVDRNTGRPYYLVVDAGNWFVGRRYLVPVGKARFDQTGRSMRLDIDKDTVKKYPKFESEWFDYDEARRRDYEGRLIRAFSTSPAPGVAGGFDYETIPEFRQPEWWRPGDTRGYPSGERHRDYPGERPISERTAARERRPDIERPAAERSGSTGREGRSTIDEPRRGGRDQKW